MANKWKNKNFIDAAKNAIEGIIQVFNTEANFRIQLVFAILAIIVGIIFGLNTIEFAIIFFTITSVIFAEFINTAIETVVDMVTEEYNEKAKKAKDISAGVTLIVALNAVVIGCLIFLPKVCEYLK